MEINNIKDLQRKAKNFLLGYCISKRNAEIMLFSFTGYINSNYYENINLIRIKGKWSMFLAKEVILSIRGEIDCFCLTRNSLNN